MSRFTGKINSQLKHLGFQVKKYEKPNYGWLIREDINTIIDIGANIGQFIGTYAKVLPNAKAYSFEPIKHCFEALKKNTIGLNVECINIGLGDKKDEPTIKIYNHNPSSSLLEMAKLHEDLYPHSKGFREEVVKIERLDDFFADKPVKGNIFVKIDVQGFELNVINGGINFLKNVKVIMIEMSYEELYVGQALFDDIFFKLYDLGFRFKGNIGQTFNKIDGSVVFSDSIFIRE